MKIRCPVCMKAGVDPVRGLLNGGDARCSYCEGVSKSNPSLLRLSVEFALFLVLLMSAYWIGRRSSFPRYWIAPMAAAFLIPLWSAFKSPRIVAGERRQVRTKLMLFAIIVIELLIARMLVGILFAST